MKCEKCPKQSEYNTSFLNRIQHIVSKQSEYIKEDQISNLLMLTEFNTSFLNIMGYDLQNPFIVFTGFFQSVYMIRSECLQDS